MTTPLQNLLKAYTKEIADLENESEQLQHDLDTIEDSTDFDIIINRLTEIEKAINDKIKFAGLAALNTYKRITERN